MLWYLLENLLFAIFDHDDSKPSPNAVVTFILENVNFCNFVPFVAILTCNLHQLLFHLFCPVTVLAQIWVQHVTIAFPHLQLAFNDNFLTDKSPFSSSKMLQQY